MRRSLFLFAAIALVASAASAAWGVAPSDISIVVGETTHAQTYWAHGFTVYPGLYVFTSDNPDVATASGSIDYPSGVNGTNGLITITGIAPGTANIIGEGGVKATITVTCGESLTVTSEPELVALSGAPIELKLVVTGGTPQQVTWYEGAIGDVSRPLAPSATGSFVYSSTVVGVHRLWAVVSGRCSSTTTELVIRVMRPRGRAAGH